MKDFAEPESKAEGGLNPAFALPVIIAVALGAVAISPQSFWPDEAITCINASQPTPAAWWNAMRLCQDSNQQMPLYMAAMWLWEKLFASNEWLVRAANLPWLALGLYALPRRQPFFALLLLTCPFVWFYLNEARPYAMQFGCGLLLLGSVWRLHADGAPAERRGVAAFALGMVLLAGSTILGMVWAGAFLVATGIFLGAEKCRRLLRENWRVALAGVVLLALLAAYYVWRTLAGNRCAPRETGVDTAAFVVYELLGFAGLGPGQVDYRNQGGRAFLPLLPWLGLYAAVVGAVLWAAVKKIRAQATERRRWLMISAVLAVTGLFLFGVGALNHVRIMGRYFAPLEPLLVLLLAVGVGELWTRGKFWRGCAMIFILLAVASAVSLRFGERHAKEDYRAAAKVVRAALAQNQRVWWCADINGGWVYGVSLATSGELATTNQAWVPYVCPETMLTNQPLPDLVVLSRPKSYDPNGAVRDLLARNHYRQTNAPHAFSFWQLGETNLTRGRSAAASDKR